jgi:hypothetical protein
MKTILLDEKGDLFLEDNFNGSQVKVETIKYYLDCPFKIEKGATFEHLFNHIFAESPIIDVIFKETMGDVSITSFVDEWNKPYIISNSLGIDYLRLRKTLEYMETDNNKGFVDIRIDFEGVGKNNGMEYSLEFMSLPEMKKFPIVLDDTLLVKESLQRKDGEESYVGGDCTMTLFEVIGTLLYEITFYGIPQERDDTKQKLIDTIDSKNLLDVLKLQLDEAVKVENYEEAANIKNLIEKYENLGKKDK